MQCGICHRSALFFCTDCEKLQCKTLGCDNQRLACTGELEQQQILSVSMENLAQRVMRLEDKFDDTVPPSEPPTMESILNMFTLLRPHFPKYQTELDEIVSILLSFKIRLAELGIGSSTPLLKEHLNIGIPVVVRSPAPQSFVAKLANKVSQPWFVLSTIVASLGFVVNALKFYDPSTFQKDYGTLATFAFVMNLSLTLVGLLINFTLNDPLQRLLTSPRHLLPAIEQEVKENMTHPENINHAVVIRRSHVLQISFDWTDSTMAISKKIEKEMPWGQVDRSNVSVQVLQNYATAFSGKPVVEIRWFNRHYAT
jgi:hypothetical protein